jgi:hypothetical protein
MAAVLMHTMDSYRFCWDPFIYYWQEYVRFLGPKYFVSDYPARVNVHYADWRVVFTGPKEWSDRLAEALVRIEEDWIFYVQEDIWAKQNFYLDNLIPEERGWDEWFDCVHVNGTKSFIYTRTSEPGPFIIEDDSPYMVCHKPAWWRKDYLLEQLVSNETPWENEIEGTKRLKERGTGGRIGLVRKQWYHDVCRKGELLPIGKEMKDAISV